MKKLIFALTGMIAVLVFTGAAFAEFVKLNANGEEVSVSETDWVAVKDKTTGLIWEKKTPENKNLQYCIVIPDPIPGCPDCILCEVSVQTHLDNLNQSLTLGNNGQWRLPTISELATIMDVGRYNPAINTDYFLNININYQYWTNTDSGLLDSNTEEYQQALAVSFSSGAIFSTGKSSYTNYVIAVRNENGLTEPMASPTFSPNNATSITEAHPISAFNGLVWQKSPDSASKKWADIPTYLNNIPVVQVGNACYNWRLPSLQELLSIVNYSKHSDPMIYDAFSASSSSFWTASEFANDKTNKAWYVNFRDGTTVIGLKTTAYSVWGVVDTRSQQSVPCPDPPAYPKGDITHDTHVDLVDVIAGLKVLDGITVTVYTDTDVNGDDKIGQEEVVYALQVTAALRPQQ